MFVSKAAQPDMENRTNWPVGLVILFAILTLASVWAFGQAESGTINGIVTDKTGALVVGATVTATLGLSGCAVPR
jgi:hypothetical protein